MWAIDTYFFCCFAAKSNIWPWRFERASVAVENCNWRASKSAPIILICLQRLSFFLWVSLIFYDMSFKDVHTMIVLRDLFCRFFITFFFLFFCSFGDSSSALCKIVCDMRCCRSLFLPTLHKFNKWLDSKMALGPWLVASLN